MALSLNTIGQIRRALDYIERSPTSELRDRLMLCHAIIGDYNPNEVDFEEFKNGSSIHFENFYREFFYRVFREKPQGILWAIENILLKVANERKALNINQRELDKLDRDIKQLASSVRQFSDVSEAIKIAAEEKEKLAKQLEERQDRERELNKIKQDIQSIESAIVTIDNFSEKESKEELETKIGEMRAKLNSSLSGEVFDEMMLLYLKGGILFDLDLDLLSTYVEDAAILQKITGKRELSDDIKMKLSSCEQNVKKSIEDLEKLFREIIETDKN